MRMAGLDQVRDVPPGMQLAEVTRLLMTYLTGWRPVGEPVPDTQTEAARDAVVALLATAVKPEAADHVVGRPRLEAALRQRVLAFIEQNIHVPELSPSLIVRHFNVSRSHLYRAFASDGGVAKCLRDKRLDVALEELTQAGGASVSVAELAHRLGFSSGNQLLRAFRNRFGMTPSQARKKGSAQLEKGVAPSDVRTHIMASPMAGLVALVASSARR